MKEGTILILLRHIFLIVALIICVPSSSSGSGTSDEYLETFVYLADIPKIQFPEYLKDRISYDATQGLLVFKGVMSWQEKNELLRLSRDRSYRKAIHALYIQAKKAAKNLANLPEEIQFPEYLKDRISYDATQGLLVFKGVMSRQEKKELLRLSRDRSYRKAIHALYIQAKKAAKTSNLTTTDPSISTATLYPNTSSSTTSTEASVTYSLLSSDILSPDVTLGSRVIVYNDSISNSSTTDSSTSTTSGPSTTGSTTSTTSDTSTSTTSGSTTTDTGTPTTSSSTTTNSDTSTTSDVSTSNTSNSSATDSTTSDPSTSSSSTSGGSDTYDFLTLEDSVAVTSDPTTDSSTSSTASAPSTTSTTSSSTTTDPSASTTSGSTASSSTTDSGSSTTTSDTSTSSSSTIWPDTYDSPTLEDSVGVDVTGQLLDKYGGYLNILLPSTGHFRVEKLGNRWVFVTPEGHPFLPIHLNLFQPHKLGTDENGKYNDDYIKQRYYDGIDYTLNWARQMIPRVKGWGFNTIGAPSAIVSYQRNLDERMPFMVKPRLTFYAVENGGPVGNIWYQVPGGRVFPDLYNPELMPFMQNHLLNIAWAKDDPYLLGYFPDQVEQLYGFDPGHPHLGWAALFGKQQILNGANTLVFNYHKQEFITWLQGRYSGDINSLNTAWGTNYTAWEDFWTLTPDSTYGTIKQPDRAGFPQFRADLDAWETRLAQDYTSKVRSVILAQDPNAIIYSPSFANEATAPMKDTVINGCIAGGNFDVWYVKWGQARYDQIGRPFMGEWIIESMQDSPLGLNGDIDSWELTTYTRGSLSWPAIKIHDTDANFWFAPAGEDTPLAGTLTLCRITGIPIPRPNEMTTPWEFGMPRIEKDPVNGDYILLRTGYPTQVGTVEELAQALADAQAQGKKGRYERFIVAPGEREYKTQEERAARWGEIIDMIVNNRGSNGDYYVIGAGWYMLYDMGWGWEQRPLGLCTLKGNAYDGREATELGADGIAGTWDDETRIVSNTPANYGDLITGVSQANKSLYERVFSIPQ